MTYRGVGATSLAALVLLTAALSAQQARIEVVGRVGTAVILRASGVPVQISVGVRTVSRLSSLQLNWLMVNDSSLRLVFERPTGAAGLYTDPWFSYYVDMRVQALDSITAFEVRVLTFNVWGAFTGTLSFSQLEDLAPGQRKEFERYWGYLGESEVRDHFTSIAYVARVRYRDGRAVVADTEPVLQAARSIQASITAQDLAPRAETLPAGTPRH